MTLHGVLKIVLSQKQRKSSVDVNSVHFGFTTVQSVCRVLIWFSILHSNALSVPQMCPTLQLRAEETEGEVGGFPIKENLLSYFHVYLSTLSTFSSREKYNARRVSLATPFRLFNELVRLVLVCNCYILRTAIKECNQHFWEVGTLCLVFNFTNLMI